MEVLDVKLVTQALLRAIAQFTDLELTNLVCQCLTWNGHETLGFRYSTRFFDRRIRVHEVEHVLSRPFLCMQAGINNQANSAPELSVQCTKVLIRIGIDADFLAERFGIETPAFGECRVAAKAPEAWQVRIFNLQRALEMVPGYCLVQEQ